MCVSTVYSVYLPEFCGGKKSQAYYSGRIRIHDICNSRTVSSTKTPAGRIANVVGSKPTRVICPWFFFHRRTRESANTHRCIWVKTKINICYPWCKFNIYIFKWLFPSLTLCYWRDVFGFGRKVLHSNFVGLVQIVGKIFGSKGSTVTIELSMNAHHYIKIMAFFGK